MPESALKRPELEAFFEEVGPMCAKFAKKSGDQTQDKNGDETSNGDYDMKAFLKELDINLPLTKLKKNDFTGETKNAELETLIHQINELSGKDARKMLIRLAKQEFEICKKKKRYKKSKRGEGGYVCV